MQRCVFRFGTSGLRLDNPRDGVNQLLVPAQRRGETASGKRRRGARMAVQAGLGSKRRDAEVRKTRPVAALRTERDVNGRAGMIAGKRIGSSTQTTGILRSGDTGKVIDLEWLTQNSHSRRLPFISHACPRDCSGTRCPKMLNRTTGTCSRRFRACACSSGYSGSFHRTTIRRTHIASRPRYARVSYAGSEGKSRMKLNCSTCTCSSLTSNLPGHRLPRSVPATCSPCLPGSPGHLSSCGCEDRNGPEVCPRDLSPP
jgi:hypothetical protein